ncbi:methyltransferase domain-containing protein [Ruegeria arenilitoris]|uniref:methyltransferase domain-containing protein n=1 Tax=Ruegeria arenilitoris TaxID=1173585 RepID=UPI00147F3D51|nr:methyltransferase domain-containing protein [Ruegeria arenilitoris]
MSLKKVLKGLSGRSHSSPRAHYDTELESNLNAALKKKLSSARQANQKLEQKIAAVKDSNTKLGLKIVAQKGNNAKLVQQKKQLESLLEREKRKVENLRFGKQEVDPIQHNSEEGMDSFFSEIRSETPYLNFGMALKKNFSKWSVTLDGKSIADVGTGPGIALSAIIEGSEPQRIVGYDFSESALKYAKKLIPNAVFHKKNIFDPFDEMHDVVFCTEVLEHLERPKDALQNVFSSVSEGGVLIVSVPDGRVDYSRYHINFWSPESWKAFVSDALPSSEIVYDSFRASNKAHYDVLVAIAKRQK